MRVFCSCKNEMTLEDFDDEDHVGKYWYCDECYQAIKITDDNLKVIE